MPRNSATDTSLKKTLSVRVHKAVHAEFEQFKRVHSLSSEQVITRAIQLVRKEFDEVGKTEMLSRFSRGLSKTVSAKLRSDIEGREIEKWEIESGTKY